MKKVLSAAIAAIAISPAFAADPQVPTSTPSAPAAAPDKPAAPKGLQTEEQKAIYALGFWVAQRVAPFHLSAAELKIMETGLRDAVANRPPQIDLGSYGQKLQELAQKRSEAAAGKEEAKARKEAGPQKEKGKAYAEAAAKEAGARKFDSGLIMIPIKEGAGATPAATDTVKVHYVGRLIDGTEFDNSVKRGQPAEFPLNGVIPCWTEGVQKIKVGGKAKLICPSSIAYGDSGRPSIPGGAALVFEVELLDILKSEPAAAPADDQAYLENAAKEKGAKRFESGLVFIPIKEGSGASPTESSVVKVHYRGTLIDGKEFDSSYKSGKPAEFALNQVIPCWTEGVQKLKVGGKAKLVCPSSIAYRDRGMPPDIPGKATLAFEVELLEVKK